MATETFCTVCQRTVYLGEDDLGEGDSNACPVCSTPLLPSEDLAG